MKLVGTAPFAGVVLVNDNVSVNSSNPNAREVEFEWRDTQPVPGKTSYCYLRGTQVGETETREIKSLQSGETFEKQFSNEELVRVSPTRITCQP